MASLIMSELTCQQSLGDDDATLVKWMEQGMKELQGEVPL